MARPLKQGLDYYPLDVEFYRDIKMRRLTHAFGVESLVLMLTLVGIIYKEEGYFTHWNEEVCFLVAADNYTTEEQVTAVVQKAVAVGYFDQMCYETYGILTSSEIQKHYLAATYKRKQVTMVAEYFLVPEDARGNLHLVALDKSPQQGRTKGKTGIVTELDGDCRVGEAVEVTEAEATADSGKTGETEVAPIAKTPNCEKVTADGQSATPAPMPSKTPSKMQSKEQRQIQLEPQTQSKEQRQRQPKPPAQPKAQPAIQQDLKASTPVVPPPNDGDCPPAEKVMPPLAEAELAKLFPAGDWQEENPDWVIHPAEMQENFGSFIFEKRPEVSPKTNTKTSPKASSHAKLAVFPQANQNTLTKTESFKNWHGLWQTPNLLIQKELARLVNEHGDLVVALAVQIAGEKQVRANHALSFVKSCLLEWTQAGVKELEEIQVYQKQRNQRNQSSYGQNWRVASRGQDEQNSYQNSQNQSSFAKRSKSTLRPGQELEDWTSHKTAPQDRQTWLRLQKECALLMGAGYVPDENFIATPAELAWIKDEQADYQNPVYLNAAGVFS
ncbi:DUF4373 domain-containing protein [Enterococcus asini]|uniref:Lin1244/Lin1753 domain-containing protein n=1 Tax=Enterococcus asini TaxID=57732 RepID=UPI00288F76EC|nr:Lin1244/Lin1753 domain-containing protein [Enterococcus asini]MDT2757689.1 DUF4373 domain-containing protein [Enterococcus asini]